MDLYEKAFKNVSDEYNSFRIIMFKRDKSELWKDSGKIHFYRCIYDYFSDCEIIDEKWLEAVANTMFPVCMLWDFYLKYEGFEYLTWNGIEEILDTYAKRYERSCQRLDSLIGGVCVGC